MTHLPTSADRLFPGDSEMAARMRDLDWARTPLGPVGGWPQSLRTAVSIVLESAFPMIVLWGEQHVQLYNDGYRDLLGARHPGGLGQPNRECWPEMWAFNEPIYQGVRERGETFSFTDQHLMLPRHGAQQEAYFTLSYSPVRDEHGEVCGVLVTVLETTERVLAERQVRAQNAELDARHRALAVFAELTRDVGAHGDRHAVIQRAQEVALSLLPEGFALHYELDEATWRLRVQTNDLRDPELQAVVDAGLAYASARNLVIPWETRQPHYQDEYELGFDGHAEHLTHVRATATLPVVVNDQPVGVFAVGLFHTRSWSTTDRAVLETVARSLELALERTQQARQLDEERAALAAFVRFTETSTRVTDVLVLAGHARDVLRATLGDVSVGYYELEEGRWKARMLSEDTPEDFAQTARLGFPADLPSFARPFKERGVVFVDGWDAVREGAENTGAYGAAALYPYFQGGSPSRLLGIGSTHARAWTERERSIFLAVSRSLELAFERAEQNAELDARARTLEGFAELSRDLTLESNPLRLVRRVQELVLGLLPAGFSLYFEPDQNLWRIRSQVGQVNTPQLQAVLDAGLPFEDAPNLLIPWQTGELYYQDQYDHAADHLNGSSAYPGATVTMPVTAGNEVRGVLGFAVHGARRWSNVDRAMLETVRRHLSVALERTEQARALQERTAALDALATFNEAVGTHNDVLVLARRAVDVVHASLEHVSAAYYELDADRWKARVWSEDLTPEVIAQIRAGVPIDALYFAEAVRARSAAFVDGWDAPANHLPSTASYGAVALIPFFTGGQPRGMFAVGARDARAWTYREKTLVRAVTRGLHLALERADTALHLQAQNAELDARTRALEAFVELSHNLRVQSEPNVLIKRAMQVVLPLLPPGYAIFHQITGVTWHVTVQEGDVGSPRLQAALDAGLKVGSTPTLDRAFQTRQPFFQSPYDPHLDVAPELVWHQATAASLPVLVNAEVMGVLTVALFRERRWSAADRAVLETTVRSLGLAIEGWRGVGELARERGKLAAANEELEAFAYSVSHDLRTPVRHITAYNALLRKSLGEQPGEKTVRYVTVIDQAAARMRTLIDAMLDLSRTARLPLRLAPVDLGEVVQGVRQEFEPDVGDRNVQWRVATLPLVQGDRDTLRQVMVNLLSNALKYSQPREVAVIEVWAEEREHEWLVFVRDNGVGFDPRYQQKLFGVFQRLHREDEFEGTGIGLANVRRIIHRHDGRVWAQSQPEQGATFGFTLPKHERS